MDTKIYWKAMKLYNKFLAGKITEKELYKDPKVAEVLRKAITPAIGRIKP